MGRADKNKRRWRRGKKTPESVHSIHEHMDWYGDERGYVPPSVGEPTSEQPGSAEKLKVLRRRADRGEALWNAEDIHPE